jgi:hypothetical protein
MAIPSSGPIKISDIAAELGYPRNTTMSLGNASARSLAGISSGTIRLYADYRGKFAWVNTTYSTAGTYTITLPYFDVYVDLRGARGGQAAARSTVPGYGGRQVFRTNSSLYGQTVTVVVGGSGGDGVTGARNAGGGGGYSGLFVGSVAQANYIAIAGGGGGCATGNPSESVAGGNGAGYGNGSNGGQFGNGDYGRGATTTAGGAGATSGTNYHAPGENGSALQGGRGANQNGGLGGGNGATGGTPGGGAEGGYGTGDGGGGGGGGGYFGGGGGASDSWGGGGGGGSGNLNATYGSLIRTASGYQNGAGYVAITTTDPG